MNIDILYTIPKRFDDRQRISLFSRLSEFYNLRIIGSEKDISINTDIVIFFLLHENSLNSLSKDFYISSIKKIIVEEDHYTEDRSSFVLREYEKINNLLVIRRHFYNEKYNFESVWVPFSASDKEFYDMNLNRENKVGFVGSYSNEYNYSIRKKAINTLMSNNLMTEAQNGHVYKENKYVMYLNKFKAFLTCAGGTIHTPMAKFFEIGLSGTAILTNSMYEDKLLFGNKQCYFEYKDDCSNLIEVAKFVLNEDVSEVTRNCIEVIKEKHTDDKRLVELVNILSALHEGKEIPRIWGQ